MIDFAYSERRTLEYLCKRTADVLVKVQVKYKQCRRVRIKLRESEQALRMNIVERRFSGLASRRRAIRRTREPPS